MTISGFEVVVERRRRKVDEVSKRKLLATSRHSLSGLAFQTNVTRKSPIIVFKLQGRKKEKLKDFRLQSRETGDWGVMRS